MYQHAAYIHGLWSTQAPRNVARHSRLTCSSPQLLTSRESLRDQRLQHLCAPSIWVAIASCTLYNFTETQRPPARLQDALPMRVQVSCRRTITTLRYQSSHSEHTISHAYAMLSGRMISQRKELGRKYAQFSPFVSLLSRSVRLSSSITYRIRNT